MKEKIKILSINTKKKVRKPKTFIDAEVSMGECIEQLVPGMYTISEVYESDAIERVETLQPEIIWILQEASGDCLHLVNKIKKMQSEAVIFILFFGVIDDEQEVINTYSTLGVYKCYFLPPLVFDTLIHDMHVALNLE